MFRSCFCRSRAYSAAPLRNFHKFRRRGRSSRVQDATPALENAPTPRLLTSNGPPQASRRRDLPPTKGYCWNGLMRASPETMAKSSILRVASSWPPDRQMPAI